LGAGQWVKESEHAILWRTRLGRLEVGMAWRDFRVVGQDRGGLVACTKAVARRVSPCFTMFQDIDIDYRGNMVVCCNIYPDSPSHGDYVLGNLGAADSVFRIYANRKSAAWRRQLLRFRPAPPPCVRCNRFENPADYSAEAEAAIGRMMLWLDTHQATDGQVAALSCGRGAP
jgi:hypothetical protein